MNLKISILQQELNQTRESNQSTISCHILYCTNRMAWLGWNEKIKMLLKKTHLEFPAAISQCRFMCGL